jgi:Na+-transporting NADH:ubiquinone oxidoreductase subunit C
LGSHNKHTNTYTLSFIFILCTLCGGILGILSTVLKETQEYQIEVDRSKQMLMCAGILDNNQQLITTDGNIEAIDTDAIMSLFKSRIKAQLVTYDGDLTDFETANIDYNKYLNDNLKTGYAGLDKKLIYTVYNDDKIDAFVIPVMGTGLWGPMYGYICIESDGETVRGISWYQHIETPGLGANIAEYEWQKQFKNKNIFSTKTDRIDYDTAPIGIKVVKGTVSNIYPNSPEAYSAVDGMSGATITGNGVSQAYKNTLSQYRSFLLKHVSAG